MILTTILFVSVENINKNLVKSFKFHYGSNHLQFLIQKFQIQLHSSNPLNPNFIDRERGGDLVLVTSGSNRQGQASGKSIGMDVPVVGAWAAGAWERAASGG
jgi:hypothetical protein